MLWQSFLLLDIYLLSARFFLIQLFWCSVNPRLVVFCLSLFLSSIAFSESTIVHPVVIVEAEKISLDDVDPEYLTSHVTVISKESFDTKLATVADVLKNEAGVQIRQIGGLGSFSTVNIRGSNSKQVNVYLNGILLNGAFGGSVDLSQFALDNVEKIEIYRGNTPVSLGFSGVGGAINIRTREYRGKPLRELKLGYGSFESKNVAVSLSDSYEGNEIYFSSEYLASDNDFQFTNNNLTPSNSRDDFSDRRNNANFDQVTSLLSFNRALDQNLNVGWVSQFFNKTDYFPDTNNSESDFAVLDTDFLSTHLKMNYQVDQFTRLATTAFVSRKTEFYEDEGNSVGVDDNKEEGVTTTFGFGLQSSHAYKSHLVSANLEAKLQKYSKEDFKEASFFEYQRVQSILGIQDEWVSDSAAWLINIGGRLFNLEDDSKLIGVDDSRSYVNSHLGLLYSVNNTLQFHSNISRNIRIPQLYELYGDRGLFKGNDELLPETAINTDIGARFSFDKLSTKASLFYRELKDGIYLSYGSTGVGKAINISDSQVMGFELDASYKLNHFLSGNIKSTFQDSREITESTDRDGNSLPGLYRVSNFISTSVSADSWVYTLEYRHQSGGFFDLSNDAAMPDQNQVNISAKWRMSGQSLEFSLDNLTDKNIVDFNRYPMPGRRFFVVYKKLF